MAAGIIVVDKPSGWTSQDVAAKLRGVFHERRIGHGGTLDPMATGVLPIFVGRATRAAEYFESAQKEYVAGLRLGIVTDTQDTEGDVLETASVQVTRAQIEQTLASFLGPQQQIPPMYSAVKIGGKKLYELARAGKTVERPARSIEILELELLDGDGADWSFRVRCTKGTYVRTLCHDLGASLGCGGCMSSLRRTAAGCYGLSHSHTMTFLTQCADPASLLLPVDSLFTDLPACTLTQAELPRCRNGADITRPDLGPGRWRVYAPNGDFWMVGCWKNGMLKTEKSFFEV